MAGGSSVGSMDHIVAALAIKRSGLDAQHLKYIPYSGGGGHAMVGLLSGETQLLSTGLSEAIALAEQGEVRILAMTASSRLPHVPDVPTLTEHGAEAVFVNWRGFFAAPGATPEQITTWSSLLDEMRDTPEWQTIRDNRGWSDFFVVGDDFVDFLEAQEEDMAELLTDLGLQ